MLCLCFFFFFFANIDFEELRSVTKLYVIVLVKESVSVTI